MRLRSIVLPKPKLNPQSVRLALNYLAIIMVLSVGFSFIFYRTSTQGLSVQIQNSGSGKVLTKTANASQTIAGIGIDLPTVTNTPTLISPTQQAAVINRELQLSFTTFRANLRDRLILLNFGAIIVGALFSYYLARRTLEPMEAAMDAQVRFSSDASHELRTPLTAIRARNEVALRKDALTLAEAKQVMRGSIEQTMKLEKLSDGLLRLSRNNSNGITLVPTKLSEITNDAMNQVIDRAQAKHIEIEDQTPDLIVMGDHDSLTQLVTILFDNAVKYSGRNTTIYVNGEAEGKYGVLHVRDEGPGIRATDLPHVFERFYRADYARTKEGEQGYGLGLSIAKKLAAQNKGSITVDSTLGEGATFTLQLPITRL